MKQTFSKQFAVYLLLKYTIGIAIAFFPFKNFSLSQTNPGGIGFGLIILMFYPIIDIALFAFPLYFSIKNIGENNGFKKISLLIIPIVFLIEIYISMITSQGKLMEWHIWKSVLGFAIFVLVFRKSIFPKLKSF